MNFFLHKVSRECDRGLNGGQALGHFLNGELSPVQSS